MRRLALVTAMALPLGLGAMTGAVGWHYSNQILGPDRPPARRDQPVLAVTETTVVLARTSKALRPGEWAIEWDGGYGRLGAILDSSGGRVRRGFEALEGRPPESVARLAGFARDANPRTWLGLEFSDIRVPAAAGKLPAWFVPGDDSTWVILVHGRGATRAEVLRMLPIYHARGLPCLVITYRNQEGAPRFGDGRYRMGTTEWRDVEDAVRFARRCGAKDVVLVGCSMGGGIVVEFLRRSDEVRHARGAILDAPALDWPTLLAHEGEKRGLPPQITALGAWFASVRSGIDWPDLVQVQHATDLSTPILIVHGEADDTVPLAVSRRFAAARGDLVTLVTVAGAGHVESTNLDPDRCTRAIHGWLDTLGNPGLTPAARSSYPRPASVKATAAAGE